MDALGEPEGGQWNFDANNRQKLPKDHVIPPPKLYHRDVAALQAMLEAAGVETTGQLDEASWGWLLTREEELDLLDYFVAVLLPHFGDYQDALTPDSWSVYHSRLSFAMNTKLLSPDEVNRSGTGVALQSRTCQHLPSGRIHSAILGWREYMRGVYWAHAEYAELNFFDTPTVTELVLDRGDENGVPACGQANDGVCVCAPHPTPDGHRQFRVAGGH